MERELDGQGRADYRGGRAQSAARSRRLSSRREAVRGRSSRAVTNGRARRDQVGELAAAGGKACATSVGDVRDSAHGAAATARAIDTWSRRSMWSWPTPGSPGDHRRRGRGEASAAGPSARHLRRRTCGGVCHLRRRAGVDDRAREAFIAISSVLGEFGAAGQAAYCATKAGAPRSRARARDRRGPARDHVQRRLPRLGRHRDGTGRESRISPPRRKQDARGDGTRGACGAAPGPPSSSRKRSPVSWLFYAPPRRLRSRWPSALDLRRVDGVCRVNA